EPIRLLCAGPGGVWAAGPETLYHAPTDTGRFAPVPAGRYDLAEADALLGDGDGVLLGNPWGLFRARPGGEPEAVAPDRLPCCTGLARDAGGAVWVATEDAVYRLRDGALGDPLRLPDNDVPVRGLAGGRDVLWVWTASGLGCVRNDRWQPVAWPAGP